MNLRGVNNMEDKDENCDPLADFDNILNISRN
jgi:hypothetical protein